MTDTARIHRQARMILEIDAYLGMESTPLVKLDLAPTANAEATTASTDLPSRIPAQDAPRYVPQSKPKPPARPAPPSNNDMAKRKTPSPVAHLSPPDLLVDGRATGTDCDASEKQALLDELAKQAAAWLNENWPQDGWQNVVFGEGNPDADLMFVGEAPGADEDKQGRPFVGRSGQLLEKQIAAMGFTRSDVYIANIGKVRPPANRVPTPEEAKLTLPFLIRQIEIIQPKALVSLGATSAKYLLDNPKLAITRMRGTWQSFAGIPLMPTFHPAYLLRQYTKENRARVWDDLQKVIAKLAE